MTHRKVHEAHCLEKRTCPHCHIVCITPQELTRHIKVCPNAQHACPMCGLVCTSHATLTYHRRICRKRTAPSQEGKGQAGSDTKRPCIRCRTCGHECRDRGELYRHYKSQHGGATDLQVFPVDVADDVGLEREYDINRAHILAPHRENRNGAVYNFPTND